MAARALVAGLAVLLWAGQAVAQPVLGSGHEGFFAAALGVDAQGCAFEGASIEPRRVLARYRCGDDLRTLELRHVDDPAGGATRTRRFRLGGEVPGPVTEAVAARLRASEADFVWDDAPRAPPGARSGGRPRVDGALAAPLVSAAAFVVLLALLAWRGPSDPTRPAPPAPPDRRAIAAAVAVITVGLAARVVAAWLLPWDRDEPSSLPAGGWREVMTVDLDLLLHPPLHRLVLAVIPGIEACPPRWLARVPSVIAGGLGLGLVNAAARRRLGPRRALLPLALVALTPLVVFVDALARPYAMVGAAGGLGVWAAEAAFAGRAERRHWVGAAASLGLLAWLDYPAFGAALIAAAGLLAWRARAGASVRAPAACLGVSAAVACAPWLGFATAGVGHHLGRHADSLAPYAVGPARALWALASDLTGGELSVVLVLGLLGYGLTRPRLRVATGVALLSVVALTVVAQQAYLRPRNVAFLVYPIALVASAAALGLAARRPRLGWLVLALLIPARVEQAARLAFTEENPPIWASEAVLHRALAAAGAHLTAGGAPRYVQVEHDVAVLPRLLFDDRCEPRLVPPEDPGVRAGTALGALEECGLPPPDHDAQLLRRPGCPSPPECRIVFERAGAAAERCPRRAN